jgi:hypothetical protein
MVPLVGLFLNDPTVDDPRASVESCQAQVETAMMTLARMQSVGHTAKRSLDAISRIYEASKRGQGLTNPDASGVLAGSFPAGRDMSTLFSPAEPARTTMPMTDSGFLDPLTTPFENDSGGQYLWEYLSWSDNNLWPGIAADIDGRHDAMTLLTPEHEKGPKYVEQPYFDPIPDPGYFVNQALYY